MAEKLQSAKFVEFWALVKANAKLVSKVVGFESAARRFILKAAGMTFREVGGHIMVAWLGLGAVEDLTSGVLDSAHALDLTGLSKTGLVVFPHNADNHPMRGGGHGGSAGSRQANVAGGEVPKLEQFTGLIQSLRKIPVGGGAGGAGGENANTSSPVVASMMTHNTVSPAAMEAVTRMKREIAVASGTTTTAEM
jgi:hypothetical protein